MGYNEFDELGDKIQSIIDSAETHIQNMAPGPPIAIAPATPAILPVPTVAASAVHTAWKGVIAPSDASRLRKIRPRVVLIA